MKRKNLWLLLLCLLILATPGQAQKKAYALSLPVFRILEEAQLLADTEAYTEALALLETQLTKRSSNYEKAQIYSLMGSLHYRRGDPAAALNAFTRVLDFAGTMPVRLHQQTLKTLAQLHMADNNFAMAKGYCEQLIALTEAPGQRDFALLAQAQFKLEQWQEALVSASRGREIAYAQQQQPDENILLLINASYYQTGALPSMPAVLEELIRLYPKKNYILYLASIFGQLDRLDKQTVLMESLYEDGKLNEDNQLRNLANLYMSEKAPYKAAVLLESALADGRIKPSEQNYQLLAQAWRLAAERERAAGALGMAADRAETGEHLLTKAYLHFDMAQWHAAHESVKGSLTKGLDTQEQGKAWLLLGMTYFQLREYDEAITACKRAFNFDTTQQHAAQWISYIEGEQLKREKMLGEAGES